MKIKEAINEIKELIQNTDFEIDYSECDEKDGFAYVVVKIASSKE